MATQRRTVRNVDSVPSGFVLGRKSKQVGPVELISVAELGRELVAAGLVIPGVAGPGGGTPAPTRADFAVFWSALTVNSAVFCELPITLGITLPLNLAGSQFTSRVAATADYTFTLNHNGSPIGTIVFHAVGSPTVTFSSAVNLSVGDIFSITGPSTADSTLADIGLSFKATVT